MAQVTPELALTTAEDDDDTADTLTIAFTQNWNVLDGLFNGSTGHTHDGAHQGGPLILSDVTLDSIIFRNGATIAPTGTGSQLKVTSDKLVLSAGLGVTGQIDLGTGGAFITPYAGDASYVQISQLTVTPGTTALAGLTVNGGATVNGNIGLGGVLNLPSGASLTATRYTMVGGASVLVTGTDHVRLLNHADVDYNLLVGQNLQVNGQINANGAIINPWFSSSGGAISMGTSTVYWGTGLVAGKPTYVIGQGGDGYFHWYDANKLGAPAAVLDFVGNVNAASQGPGATSTLAYTTVENDLPATNNSTSVTVTRTGQYSISLVCIWQNNGANINDTVTLRLRRNGGDIAVDSHNAPDDSVPGRWVTTWRGLLNNGDQISGVISNSFDNAAYGGGASQLIISFIPTQDYPG